MAVLRIPDENRSLREHGEVRDYLAGIGINYERWESPVDLPSDASADHVLSAYCEQIEKLKCQGGYVTADVIDVNSDTPGLDAMLAKFSIEHTHDEDEVRYIIAGRGLFHIHPPRGPVEIGRASCRERVERAVVEGVLKKKKRKYAKS